MAKTKQPEVEANYVGPVSDVRPAPDYFDVVFLKQIERDGSWSHMAVSFPTRAAADEYADTLREGRHGAIKVIPRSWA